MATVAENPHSPQGDLGQVVPPFKFPRGSKLTFVTVCGLDTGIPTLEDIPGIKSGLLSDIEVGWDRFSYQPLDLLTEGVPHDTVPRLAHELLQQMRDGWSPCRGAYIALCASDIGAIIVKEALLLAATDPLYQKDNILSRTCLVAFFGSPHRAATTGEMVSIIYNLLQTFHQDQIRSRTSPKHLTELACYLVELASRFEKAQKPYQVISCFQQCGPQSLHAQIVPESYARTFVANEITLGLDRPQTQLHAGIGYKEEEFWRVQFEDACTRKLSVYQELARVLYTGFPQHCPRSRLNYRNLADAILNRDNVNKWSFSNTSARRQSFLHLTKPHFPVRSDVLGHAIASALHSRISKNVLFQPITLYLDAEKIVACNSDARAVSEAYGLLCAGLLAQQPNLAMHLWDVNVLEMIYTKEQRLFSALGKQLRGLFIKLASFQSTSREVIVVINLSSWSTLVNDVLNTLSNVVRSTDSQLTVVLLTASANQGDSAVSCRIPVSSVASFCTETLDGVDISDALDEDIRDWLADSNISSSVPLCTEVESEAFRRLRDTASWPEAEQFLVYLEQVPDHAKSPISFPSLERSSANRLSKAIRVHGNWLLVALLWIYNANRPLTLDELDEAVSFDLSVGPDLMSSLLSDSPPAPAQGIPALSKEGTKYLRLKVVRDVIRAIPGAVVIDNGRVFPVDEHIRQYLADPINLKPIAVCSPSSYLALSCLLRIEYELMSAHSDPNGNNGVSPAHPTGIAEYAFASWAEHFLMSPPSGTASKVPQDDTLYGNINLALESLATRFLNTSAEVERWLKFVKVPVAEWSNPEVIDEVAIDRNILPTLLHSELNISMRQAVYLATRLLTRLDTWNSNHDSLLLTAVHNGDNFLWNALRCSRKQKNQPFQAETIAQVLLTASLQMKDHVDETLDSIFPLLDAKMTFYCIASQDPEIVGLITSNPVKRGHVEYLLRVGTQLGDLPLLEKILERVNDRGDENNYTEGRLPSGIEPALVAAVSGQSSVMQKLLQIDIPINIHTEPGWTAVMLASVNGFADIVKLLLKEEVIDINAQSHMKGDSALHLSSRSGCYKTVNILLGHKADPLLENSDGDLPLHLALAHGHLEVAELLLESMLDHLSCEKAALLVTRKSWVRPQNVDPDQDMNSDNSDTGSESDFMTDSEDASDHDTSGLVSEGQTICPFNTFNSSGTTAFILAAHQGSVSICDKMLAKHADPKLVDAAEMSALDHAAQEGSVDLIDLLLKTHPNTITEWKFPRTALYYAARSGHLHVAQKLLDYNNDLVNRLNEDDELPPLHAAITFGHSKVMDIIIKGCLKVGVTHAGLAMALLYATRQGNISVMESLLDHGVDINAVDEYQNTALHFAAYNDLVQQVELLVMRKAQLDCTDNDGFTPLMDATRNNSLSSLNVLINAGANLEFRNDFGSSALDLATENQAMECGKLLVEKLQRNPGWLNPSSRDLRQGLQFTLLGSSGTDLATSMLNDVVGKNLEKSQDSSVKGFICSLLWNTWLTVFNFFWTHWDASALQLGDYGTALHYAAMRHQTSVVEAILTHPKHSIAVNNESSLYGTALQAIIAIQPKAEEERASAFLDTVQVLLKHGADPRIAGKVMAYVLQSAVFNRRKELSMLLLEKLRPKDILRLGGQHGTALQALLAGPQRDDDVVEELMDLLLENYGESVMRKAKGYNEGVTALHRAAEHASLRVVQHLMKLNDKPGIEIDINQADFMGRLPIHLAVWSMKDRWDIVQALDPELKTLWKSDRLQRTVLHLAAKTGDIKVVEHIIETAKNDGLNIRELLNKKDIDGWTPLHWACRSSNNKGMISLLRENGADVDAVTHAKWLPRHVAVYHDRDYLRPDDGEGEDQISDDVQGELPNGPAQYVRCVCNGCLSFCFGDAWHCTTCTKENYMAEFDLCFKCYAHKDKVHPAGHEYEPMTEDWYWSFRQEKAALFKDVE